jgi:hypothetical protein
MKRGGEAGQQEPGADQNTAEEGADLWPLEILQATRGYEGERETDDGDRVHPRRVRTLPAEFLFERQHEHAPGVQRPEREIHQDAAGDR